jgi:membrane protease YdiL (CAAX protease family)
MGLFVAAAAAQDQGAPPGWVQRVESLRGMTVTEMLSMAAEYRLPLLAGATLVVLVLLFIANALQPGALAKAGLRDIKPHPWPVWLFGGLLVMMGFAFAAGWLAQMGWVVGEGDELRRQAAPTLGAYLLSIVVAWGMVRLYARSAPNAGLKFRIPDVPIGLACLLLAAPVVVLAGDAAAMLHQNITGSRPNAIAHATLERIVTDASNPWAWGLMAGAVIGAPVIEEVIYRVFIQSALLRLSGSPWVAIIATSGAFAGVHALGPEPVPYFALIPLFALGAGMGLAYERTRRLGVPIVMHMGFNAANIALALQGQAPG